MRVRTLLSHQRYFGMEPMALRHAAGRVLLRVPSHDAGSLRPPGTRIGIALTAGAAIAFRSV